MADKFPSNEKDGVMITRQASVLDALRSATMQQHRTLERTPLMASLLDSDLNLDGYAAVVVTFARLFATLDPLLSAAAVRSQALPAGYRYEPRLPYLEQDLAALLQQTAGISRWRPASSDELFAGTADSSLVRCAQAQAFTTEQTLGLLYVIEGASQGGRIIAPRLTKQLKLKDNVGLSYFSHFAFEATDWAILRQGLTDWRAEPSAQDQHQQPRLDTPRTCAAACSMFEALVRLSLQQQVCATHSMRYL